MGSESLAIESGQKVYLLATDNNEWISMVADDGTEGWVNVFDVTDINFSGFPMYD